jgi:hypothetical protein
LAAIRVTRFPSFLHGRGLIQGCVYISNSPPSIFFILFELF